MLLIIGEIQIKTKMRYHLTHVSLAIISHTHDNKRWQGCWEKGTFVQSWWECEMVHIAPVENSKIVLKKLKVELPYNPTLPLLGKYQKN